MYLLPLYLMIGLDWGDQPCRVETVSPDVKRQWFDFVLPHLAALGLQPGSNVGEELPVLSLDSPDLDL